MNNLFTNSMVSLICSLIVSNGILWWGIYRFVPDTLNNYGFDYCNWKRYRRQSLIGGLILLAVGNLMLTSAGKLPGHSLPVWSSIGLALFFVSLWGVFRLDRTFQIIPDRFHLTGILGAGVFFAAKISAEPTHWKAAVLYSSLGMLLPGLLALLNVGYAKIRNSEGLGLGDLKTLIWMPLVFEDRVWLAFMLACFLASAAQILKSVWVRRVDLRQSFAFGPFLVVGALLVHLIG